MTDAHELRTYEYVNRPYAAVRDALKADPAGIFSKATHNAAGRASSLAANLRVELGALEVGTDVSIEVESVEERPDGPGGRTPTTCVKLHWRAAHSPGIFPSMHAELFVYALSKDETQLDLHGLYTPPLGAVGSAIDSLVGHRIAEASVHRFVADVAKHLRAG
jgi:hypothetical protein